MTKKKLLAVVLCAVILATQFAMLGGVLGVSAAANYTALSGRNDFLMGVNIHPVGNSAAYNEKQYAAIFDAKNLGSNIIRIDGLPALGDTKGYDYYKSVGDVAATKDMQVMLVANAFKNYLCDANGNYLTASQLDLNAISAHFTELATALKGNVKYYQLGNEMDNGYFTDSLFNGSGENFNKGYNTDEITAAAVAINVARNAIKAADPDAQVGVNFGYYHRGFIHGLKTVDCDLTTAETQTLTLDYIGMDFYSNMIDEGLFGSVDYTDNIEDLAKYDEPIIVCEANIAAEGWDNNNHDNVTYDEDADWLAEFATYCYNSDDVAGFIAYELYDEPALGGDSFYKEKFFGLIDKYGNKKETYTALQQLFGGVDAERGEITEVTAETVGDTVTGTLIDGIYENDNTFALKYSDSNFVFADNLATVDLSGGDTEAFRDSDFFEFDLYVEDAAALKAAAADVGGVLYVQVFGTNGENRLATDIPLSVIKNDGWNHIALHRRAFTQGKESAFTCVNKVVIRLRTPSAKSETKVAITGMKIAVANVCKTRVTSQNKAEMGDVYQNQLGAGAYVARWGESSGARTEYPLKALNVGNANLSGIFDKGFIEFDFYVENYENLMKSLSEDVNGNAHSLELNFYISSNATAINGNFFRYNLAPHLKQDGWNHVVLQFKGAVTGNVYTPIQTASMEQTSVKSFGLRFVGTPAGNIAAANDVFAIKNLTASIFANPVNNQTVGEVQGTVFEDAKMSTTVNSDYRIYDSGKVFNANLSGAWSSEAGLIEFDLYVSDVDALKKSMSKGSYFTLLVVGNNSLNREAHFSFAGSGITKNGWNHIVLSRQNFTGSGSDWSSVTRVILGFYVYNNNAPKPTDECKSLVYGIANFKGTKITKTTATENKLHTSQLSNGAQTNSLASNGTLKDSGIALEVKNLSPTANYSALFEKGSIEFDFYVPDYEGLMKSLKQDINGNAHDLTLCFYISSNKDSIKSNFFRYDLGAQLKNDGWNHIVLSFKGKDEKDPTSPIETAGLDQTAIKTFGIRITGTAAGKIAAGWDMFAMTNIVATFPGIKKPAVDNIANLETMIFDSMQEVELSSSFSTYIHNSLSSAVNTVIAGENPEYIEFDFYVEDYETFTAALSAGSNHLIVRISSNTDDFNRDSLTAVDLEKYITKSGWNHIQIPFSAFEKGSTSGTYNASALRQIRFRFNGTTTNSTGDAKGMALAVANIAATTDMIVPTDVMNEYNAIIDGTANISVAGDGYTVDFAEPMDISNDNLFEMDAFVSDAQLNNILVMFVDVNGLSAMYDFAELNTKWNHLAVRLDDFVVDDGFDATQVVSCMLMSETTGNGEVTVANFYTAFYLEGDGNRDGAVDVKDIIRMKNYILNNTSVGNKIAMNVDGEDEVVNGVDLTELKYYLLTNTWR
ncbi:MAG: hypothetical protein IKT38_00260 [Clostridia bacterium]|nr:hypothetical protein [Clostridia bacterium]